MLEKIETPADVRRLSMEDLSELAEEIRVQLVDIVSANGGHLASNLGVVELTIALHYSFDTPEDKLIWDVSHQGYVHKMLTGRREYIRSLRKKDGCSGFLVRGESEYDVFGAGHAGTAISAALGIAAARDRKGTKEKVVAVVGDGALNCGISLEGLNSVAETTKDFILIVNDNKMSISANVGAIPRYLNAIISGKGYNRFKAFAKMMLKKLPHGEEIRKKISKLEEATKSLFVPGVFFEELGLRYIGPVNGHDIKALIQTFEAVKTFNRPVVVHIITEKGRGYKFAEDAPEDFHSMGSFDCATGNSVKKEGKNFSQAFGEALCELADKYTDVVGITAAMMKGTGMTEFAKRFPERFFDTGITEEHAVVFAAGLSVGGLRPVVAIYSTFLQRALDCIYHDVCLQNLPVIICSDRAGIVSDGPTHHGIYDISFLKTLPNLSILAPKDGKELKEMLFDAYKRVCPVVIRYPKSECEEFTKSQDTSLEWGKAEIITKGTEIAIWAVGREVITALKTAEIIKNKKNITPTVINVRFIKPFDKELLLQTAGEHNILVTIEDTQIDAGIASVVDEILVNRVSPPKIFHFGWDDSVIPHGSIPELKEYGQFTEKHIAEKLLAYINVTK